MGENNQEISDEMIEKLSIEELADLKCEVDEILENIEDDLATCDEVLNS